MFISISKLITTGAVVRGLLIANEYLPEEDPIRLALVSKAKSKVYAPISLDVTWKKIQDGCRLIDLEEDEKIILSVEDQKARKSTSVYPIPDFGIRRTKRNYCEVHDRKSKRCRALGKSRSFVAQA